MKTKKAIMILYEMNLMNATKYTMQFKNLSILILLSCHFKNTYKYTIVFKDPVHRIFFFDRI